MRTKVYGDGLHNMYPKGTQISHNLLHACNLRISDSGHVKMAKLRALLRSSLGPL
jgi:hypothetical protein